MSESCPTVGVKHCDFSMNDSYNDRMSVDESHHSLMSGVTLMDELSPTGQYIEFVSLRTLTK